MRTQKPIKGKIRIPQASRVDNHIHREIEKLAAKFDCSKSFVVATALADTFGIEIERYYELDKPKLRKVK